MTKESLCKSCSNRVVISYKGTKAKKTEGTSKRILAGEYDSGCFFEFTVWAKEVVIDNFFDPAEKQIEDKQIHVDNLVIRECSFYNKTPNPMLLKSLIPTNDDSDDDDGDGERKKKYSKDKWPAGGLTIVNIPGALLG